MAKKPEEKILDVDASMQGTIAFKDPVNLRINGTFEGKLDTKGYLTIGENAKVRASIHGDNIVIAGKVVGNITAYQSLSVVPPASIEGDIVTPRLSVGEGASIEGRVTMKTASTSGLDVSAKNGCPQSSKAIPHGFGIANCAVRSSLCSCGL